MNTRTKSQLLLVVTLISAFGLSSTRALAQDGQTYQLSQPLPPPADTNLRLGGPITETAIGGSLMILAPLTGAVVTGMIQLQDLFGCGWDETDEACAQQQADLDQRARVTGAVVGTSLGVAGLVLLAHGAHRIRQVRQARSAFRPSAWNVDAGPQRASVNLSWRF